MEIFVLGGWTKAETTTRNALPRCTLRVGITGHRPNKLSDLQSDTVDQSIHVILDHIKVSAETCRTTHAEFFSDTASDLRLVTALAEGADTIAAMAAIEREFKLDVILPFQRDIYIEKQQFAPSATKTFHALLDSPRTNCVFELTDGFHDDADDTELYLAAGRRMLAFSDVVIAVWDGEDAAGRGGTAQIIREAIARGITVIWINLNGTACILDDREHLENLDRSQAFPTEAGAALDETVYDRIVGHIAPPELEQKARDRVLKFMTEPTPERSWWSAYNLMRSVILKSPIALRVNYAVDENTEAAWTRYNKHARKIGGEQFSETLKQTIETRWRHADAVSVHCSHAYRSTYVLNFILAGFAVLFGLLSVFWWKHDHSIVIKGGFVLAEFILIVSIIILTWLGREDRNDWHIRWLEARAFAELMRSGRTLSLIGQTASPPAEKVTRTPSYAWIEWLTRATLREIPPPTGQLDAKSLSIAIESALEDELAGQIEYNKSASKKYKHLDHALHRTGELLFWVTGAVGAAYLIFVAVYMFDKSLLPKDSKDLIKSVVTVLGAGLPAFGAALFGVKATGDFKAAAEQAKRTLMKMNSLRLELIRERKNPTPDSSLRLLSKLTSTLTTDLREWANIYELRELSLPG